ncbi:30967_t:CDS:2 [Racocetra persica]|uniref:30967_t:CDS:1 n=1 Tax=Racocetra persica TaxID=160502 RepID=A0ACA9NZ84_9GLOM|nr:30967_t:CDS:2 [Racocetra persica]
MSDNSNANVDSQQELQSLRQLRASLTSLDVLTKQILQDLEIMTRNYESINANTDYEPFVNYESDDNYGSVDDYESVNNYESSFKKSEEEIPVIDLTEANSYSPFDDFEVIATQSVII